MFILDMTLRIMEVGIVLMLNLEMEQMLLLLVDLHGVGLVLLMYLVC